ncbi:hypothetical protein CEE69_13520 [Rhodopirellula bahusiensis]|uniref:Secretion protein HlyD n=2 Tax=Rhodopirellula bahusiensis TaxID=2014065 RepID=A0A2G1W773_9BACT|nr:hypothetical protein CEE69_13520 [Rhodopirellula bahusiensis]
MEEQRVNVIPDSFLFRHQRNWQVLSIVDCEAILHPVTIGLQNDSHTQTLKELSKGDQVIVYQSDTLQPGTEVRSTSRGSSAAGESQ